MSFLLTNDNSPAARGVCNILETLPSRSVLCDRHFFVMTGGLPYTAIQHEAMTRVIKDPSLTVIIIDLNPKIRSSYHSQLRYDHVYYLDGSISLQDINCDLNDILNDVEKKIKYGRRLLPKQSVVSNITVDEKEFLMGILSNLSCKSYAETCGLSIRSVTENRRNVIIKLGTNSPASLHAQLCVDSIVENNTIKTSFNEKGTSGAICYYTRLFRDLITPEGIKVLRDL